MATGTATVIEHVDRYAAASSVAGGRIFLAASSSGAPAAPFFSGSLAAPQRGADLMLTVAQVVRTRYYTPPGMVQRIIQQSDPVITYGAGVLRFEGFSACCGVYARLDFPATAFDPERAEPGTANVDFNPPMRAALAKLRDGERARLAVSSTGFELSAPDGKAFERRVALPVRWLKGFVEVQAHQARMERRFSISGAMAQRFLRELPRQRTTGTVYVAPAGSGLRLSQSGAGGAVPVGGIERLQILAGVARHAVEIEMYAGSGGATAWRMETPDSRLFVVMSPAPARGFSGEGQALEALTAGSTVTARLRALLRWQNRLDPKALAAELGASEPEIAAALAELSSLGLVGYDLADSQYFHRELPFDLARVSTLHPRLADARRIVQAGHVEIETAGVSGWVRGNDGEYRVRRDTEGVWHCLCPWVAKHGTSRGPCKHILAVQIVSGEADDAG
jgi:hypothetical protein